FQEVAVHSEGCGGHVSHDATGHVLHRQSQEFRLSKDGKHRADQARKKVSESFQKMAHAQRQEAAQLRKEEKRKAEKEKTDERRKTQRRLENLSLCGSFLHVSMLQLHIECERAVKFCFYKVTTVGFFVLHFDSPPFFVSVPKIIL
ncbi:hypothetical protein BSL78_15993, partial [Apostichopus japonicus]